MIKKASATLSQNSVYFFAMLVPILAVLSIKFMGGWGLIASILAVIGVILCMYVYDKPFIFLFISLFIFPLTRTLPESTKTLTTMMLYLSSVPCFLYLFEKYRKDIVSKIGIFMPFIAICGCIWLVLGLRGETTEAVKEFFRWYYALFTVLAVIDCSKNIMPAEKLMKYFSYIMNFMAVIAFGQFVTKQGSWVVEGIYRVRGTFFNFNEYAYVISIFIPIAAFMFFKDKAKLYWIFTMIINVFALLLTFSKTSIILTVVIMLVMSLFLPLRRQVQIWVLIGFSVIATALFLTFTGTIGILEERFVSSRSMEWRLEMWQNMNRLIEQGNLIIGNGANAARNYLQYIVGYGESFAPHNVYLETLYNYGLLGLISFILIFIAAFFKGVKKFKENRLAASVILALVCVTLVQNYVSNAFYDRAVSIIFWAMFSAALCFKNKDDVLEM